MKIILIVPPYIDKIEIPGIRFDVNIEDLGLGYLASYLRDKDYCDVEILHCPLQNLDVKSTIDMLVEKKPDIVGISLSFESTDYIGTLETARELRKRLHNVFIFIGGHAATFMYEQILRECEEIDVVVLGEGEITTYQLIECIQNKRDIFSTSGIAFIKNGQVKINPQQKLIENLDELPFPSRDTYKISKPEIALLESSRGCWGNCNFCSVPAFTKTGIGSIWRGRSVESIVSEMKAIIDTWGINKFDIIDDNFLGSGAMCSKKINAFCKAINDQHLDIEFYFSCRVDTISYMDFDKLVHAGLKKIFVGIESGCNSVLKRFGKKVTKEDNMRAIQIINKLELSGKFCLIMFDPWMTLEEFKETLEFLNNVPSTRLIHWTSLFNQYKPNIGTVMYERYKHDKLENSDYIMYDKKLEDIRKSCMTAAKTIKYLLYILSQYEKFNSKLGRWDEGLSKLVIEYMNILLSDAIECCDTHEKNLIFYKMLSHYTNIVMGEEVIEYLENNWSEIKTKKHVVADKFVK